MRISAGRPAIVLASRFFIYEHNDLHMNTMTARYFTVEEANALLPEIRPLMAELMERRAKVVSTRGELEPMLESGGDNFGGPKASEMVLEFMAIERLASGIRSRGCVIRDLNAGLVDFLSERDGREVYLCWRYGEPRVEFYHELNAGFQGRQRI